MCVLIAPLPGAVFLCSSEELLDTERGARMLVSTIEVLLFLYIVHCNTPLL